MKRETIRDLLAEAGIEVSGAVLRNIMNAINEDIRNVQVETANKLMGDYEGYLSPKEVDELKAEISNLKDASKKSERIGKYKGAKVKDKFLDIVDAKLKDSSNFDDDLKKLLEEYNEYVEVEQTSTPPTRSTFEAGKGTSGNSSKSSFDDAWAKAHPTL